MSQTKSEELVIDEGYESVKLGSIFKYQQKSKRKSSFGKETGKYNFYTHHDNSKKCDEADYNEECLIIGYNMKANIKIDNCFSCSENNYVIKTQNAKYIYYLIKGNINILNDGYEGTFIKKLSKEYLSNITLNIPKSQEKIDEWVDKVSLQYNDIENKMREIKELETLEKNIFCEIENKEDCNIVELGSVCEIQYGQKITNNENNEGQYVVYGGNITNKYMNEYNRDGNTCKISKNCMSSNNCVEMLNIKYYLNDNAFTVTCNDKCMTEEYLHHYLYNNKEKILNSGRGICLKIINNNNFKKIKISIPKNVDIIRELDKCFSKIKELYEYVDEAKKLYEQMIIDLSQDYIKK
jgi:restriction endonuclease S subunit